MKRLATAPQCLLLLAVLSGCLERERTEVVFPPGGMALDSSGSQSRIYREDTLILVRTVGGRSDQDTTLINPYIMAADEARTYLFEADNYVIAFDSSGTRLWKQGANGGGPGEYRNPRDLKVGVDGKLWLLDPASSRITRVDRETGQLAQMIRMQVGYSTAITPTGTGFILFPPDLPGDLHYFSLAGDPARTDSLPWDGFRQLDQLARQLRTALDPRTGRSVLGFIYGNGWFTFDTAGQVSQRRYYVEATRFPAVTKKYLEHGGLETSLIRTPASALDIQLLGDTVFVLFDGQEPDRRRKVDMYSWESGRYFGSLKLPEGADNIAFFGKSVRVFSSHPVPKLAYYERRAKASKPR